MMPNQRSKAILKKKIWVVEMKMEIVFSHQQYIK
jgi:hypothetical protein